MFKKRMKGMLALHNWSIRTVMQGSFLLMVMIPLLTMVIISYQSYKSIVTEQSTRQTLQTLEQVSVGIDREASQMMKTIGYFYKDRNLLEAVDRLNPKAAESSGRADFEGVQSMVHRYFQYTDELIGVVFFYRGGGYFSTNERLGFDEPAMRTSLWYNKSLASVGQIKLFGVQPNYLSGLQESYINTAAVGIPADMSQQTQIEVIYFIFKGTLFQHLFESSTEEQGDFLILDSEYRAIAANRERYIQTWLDQPSYLYKTGWGTSSGEYLEMLNGSKTFITYYTAPVTGFKVIHVIPYASLTSPLRPVLLMTLWIGAGSTVLFLLASWFFVRTITRPISALVREMYKVHIGSLKLGITPAGPTEVYLLGSKFNTMAEEMDALVKEREEQHRAKAMAELRALQSQINPHFLLNTLNAIKLLAGISKAHNIQSMTDAFIRMLSSTFNRGGMLHTVKEEMDYLKQYLYIMEFRYGACEVSWEFDEETYDCRILKQLVQPIVENAIIHGLQHKESDGKLRLTGRIEGNKLVITVEDNGIGMLPEEMSELLGSAGKESFSGLGVSNVDERIRLHYGSEFGLQIASGEDEGTQVAVYLPVLRETAAAQNE